jgi:uncharacterized protein (TIGR03083 family)
MPPTQKPRRPPRPRPKTRAELLQREADTWAELTATWRGLPEAALTQPGACGPGWSVKDVMNHIAAWLEAALRILPEQLAGRRATLGASTNRFNAEQQAAHRGRSLAATRRRLNAARRQMLALLDEIPDGPLLDPASRVHWWVKYSSYAHYGEHIWELGEWRKRFRESADDADD